MKKTTHPSAKRLRVSVFRSNKCIYAQVIDDDKRITIAAASDAASKEKNKIKRAHEVGLALAKAVLAKGVKKVWYKVGRYRYHGRIKALAEGGRKGGLDF